MVVEEPEEEVIEEVVEAVEEIVEDVESIIVEGGNSTNTTINGTDIYVDGMNETLNASSEGNLTINSTELEGPIEGEEPEEDYDGGGHHVDSMSLDDLGEKDTTIEDIEA